MNRMQRLTQYTHVLGLLAALALVCLSPSNFAGGKVEYLRIRGAILFSKPGLNAPEANNALELGCEVDILETKGAWSKVKTKPFDPNKKSLEGWLPSAWLIEKPPAPEAIAGPHSVAAAQASAKLQAFSSLRGVDPQKSLALLERISTPTDLEAFQKDGKLGVHREDDAYPLEGAAK